MVLKLECASESLGELVKEQIAEPTSRVSDSVGLGCGLRICISNKSPGDAVTAGPGTSIKEPLSRWYFNSLLDGTIFVFIILLWLRGERGLGSSVDCLH